jgi:hypothetical protein
VEQLRVQWMAEHRLIRRTLWRQPGTGDLGSGLVTVNPQVLAYKEKDRIVAVEPTRQRVYSWHKSSGSLMLHDLRAVLALLSLSATATSPVHSNRSTLEGTVILVRPIGSVTRRPDSTDHIKATPRWPGWLNVVSSIPSARWCDSGRVSLGIMAMVDCLWRATGSR